MTDEEAVAAVGRGERVAGKHSLHESVKPGPCSHHIWRTIYCTGDIDVIECQKCGEQTTCACDFDEEYA